LSEMENRDFVPIDCNREEQIVASKGGMILWTHRPASHEEGEIDFVAIPPPVLKENQYLCEFISGTSFLQLLPLMVFLRRLGEPHGWDAPPSRACVVFDDPNLKWTNYGCLDFEQLARHAIEWNYHASIATVPIDGWWVNKRASSLFRQQTTKLSLAIHGNNHTSFELARRTGNSQLVAGLAQALRRIDKFERRHGLEVCRVLEPPHGAIAAGMFDSLVGLGYEAALVTILQFLRHNTERKFAGAIGLDVAESLPGALHDSSDHYVSRMENKCSPLGIPETTSGNRLSPHRCGWWSTSFGGGRHYNQPPWRSSLVQPDNYCQRKL
jgi:hypothetical protein